MKLARRDKLALIWARLLDERAQALDPQVTDADRVQRYADDPARFAREVLGIKPWSRQGQLLRAVLDGKRVACVSGHKTGKSTAFAILALWFYCSWPGARVVIMAATDRQVNGIIWREVKRLVRGALIEIPGAHRICEKAANGLTDPATLSEIRGYTVKETEAAAGVSGHHILYLLDEASGIPESVFAAIEGNRAGGNAWVCMISNPTRGDGTFYDAFHSRSRLWTLLHIDSRESPNITGECYELWGAPMPGLAVSEWVDEKLDEWGEDHPLFQVRVAGNFAIAEEARAFPAGLLSEMVSRWQGTDDEPAVEGLGRLWLGVDPAGDGDEGDESGFAARRGARVLQVYCRGGLSPQAHVAECLGILASHREPLDAAPSARPCIVVDAEGPQGVKSWRALREYLDDHLGAFELVKVKASARAVREPQLYDRVRDELWAVARDWARAGGACPEDTKLLADLHSIEFASNLTGRLKATPKRELRKVLGRSPDSGDALTLCCWEPVALRAPGTESAEASATDVEPSAEARLPAHGMNPYAGRDAWQRGGRRR
jgi:hypothetical protein